MTYLYHIKFKNNDGNWYSFLWATSSKEAKTLFLADMAEQHIPVNEIISTRKKRR